MRAGARTSLVAALAAGILVFGGGAAHASVRTDLGCTSGGFLAFFDAAPCPGDEPVETAPATDPATDPTTEPSTEPSTAPAPTDPATAEEAPTTPGDEATAPPATSEPVPDAPADPAGMVFTPKPAILTAGTLGISGLRSLEIVTVDLADGSTMRALKITADRVVIGGFGLDVPSGDGGLQTDASTLTVEGNATIWTPSITAILADGVEHVIDTLSTPDPAALGSLLRLRLPLLGMTADSVAYTDTDQAVHED
ncbi:hypothetical protein [Agromyces seonyuensis]|uniref:Uncharacterized protein n=1 Tax=Agromyces seonyuensis TaxID=2662446 RepID=A0A6I4P7B4_9MICO|nr:hypothetical protein [Agromyces seonyuensis]MWB99627.1 hypothetical protein [Agromyces seonyuensis]